MVCDQDLSGWGSEHPFSKFCCDTRAVTIIVICCTITTKCRNFSLAEMAELFSFRIKK